MTTASWLKRVLAWLIDMHISMLFLVLAYLGSRAVSGRFEGTTALWIGFILYAIWWSIGFYNRCILMGRLGHSWGRKVVDAKLVSEKTGRPIGVLRAFVRENSHFIDWALLGLGFLLPIWDRKRQTVADKIMRTITVEGEVPNRPLVRATAGTLTMAESRKPTSVQ